MGRKLHVENLSRTIDNQDLERLFAPHGTVYVAEVWIDPETGRATGFGLVEMESDAEARAAAAALHGREHCGHVLKVSPPAGGGESSADLPGSMALASNVLLGTGPQEQHQIGPHQAGAG